MSTSSHDPIPPAAGAGTDDDTVHHDVTGRHPTSTSTSGAVSASTSVSSADPGLVSSGGTTTIAPGVIAAIARQAASEVDGVEGVEATGLQGVLSSLRSTSSGGASADVAAQRAAIDLRLAVRWPMPIHQVTIAARDHVQQRVTELTGHAVTDVDVVVVDLPDAPRRRRPRVS